MNKSLAVISVERVEQKILRIRDEKVILDADLAKLYGVSTKRLNEQAIEEAKSTQSEASI